MVIKQKKYFYTLQKKAIKKTMLFSGFLNSRVTLQKMSCNNNIRIKDLDVTLDNSVVQYT